MQIVNDRYTRSASRLTARQLVADIGPALLRLLDEGSNADTPLNEVALYAPGAPADLGPEAIVLGVGVTTSAELDELVKALEVAGAGVIAIKAPVPYVVNPGAVTLIEVNTNASWMQVATTIREQLLDYARANVRSDGVSSELFTIANAIYREIGVPVTIEDRFSVLVAWSAGQSQSDADRIDTILGRAVQPKTLTAQRQRGEFELLHAAAEPVYMPSVDPDYLARVAIAVRAGADVLGYIWAAVAEPLSAEQRDRLTEFAPNVALRLANLRTETSYARQQRSELTADVLGGSTNQVEASRLHLGSGPICVLGAAPRFTYEDDWDASSDAATTSELRRFADTLEYFLTAVHPRSASVAGTGAVYAIISWPPGTEQALEATATLARDFHTRTPLTKEFIVAVSGPTNNFGDIKQLRAQVDASLRALRHPTAKGPTVRTVDEAALPMLLLHLADATDMLGLPETTGALELLRQHEGPRGMLTTTLGAYLDAGGMIDTAARGLHVHPNTMRYRIRRIQEISGLDFTDADAMLLAHLQLRVKALRVDLSQ